MNPEAKTHYNILAVDISKDTLHLQDKERSLSLPYDKTGLNRLLIRARKLGSALVVFEATGGYEKKLAWTMQQNGIPTYLASASRVRAFAQSDGIRAKTDPIDAKVIYRFAVQKEVSPDRELPPQQGELAQLMDRREQLISELAREKNRLELAFGPTVKSIKRMIRLIEAEIKQIEKLIDSVIKENKELNEKSDLLQSVVGVGKTTAWNLLAYLPSLTEVSRNTAVALTGLAPFNNDSGKKQGQRRIQGGRAKVRKCLYMATTTAARHNSVIRNYVERLQARGKPYKWAITAAMRKLLIHLQSLLKKHEFGLA